MAGRPAKPIDLHIVSGNPSHLTKAEIEHRKKSEIHLGEQKLVCPAYVKTNKEAYKKWKEIKKLYTGFKFVSSADVGVIARYCMAFAQYIDLIERRDRIARVELTGEETTATQEILEAEYSQSDQCENGGTRTNGRQIILVTACKSKECTERARKERRRPAK